MSAFGDINNGYAFIKYHFMYNRELKYFRLKYWFEKIVLFHCMIFTKHLTYDTTDFTISTIGLQSGVLSTLAECYLGDVTLTSI